MTDETWLTGNCNYSGLGTPFRCGALATYSSNRQQAGATYYGVMEMSGNMFELVITGGTTAGRTYTGVHGDGNLDADGLFNTLNWNATTAIGYRGGAHNSGSIIYCAVSDRASINAGGGAIKSYTHTSGRGVRTAQ